MQVIATKTSEDARRQGGESLLEARIHRVEAELLSPRVVHPQVPSLQNRWVRVFGVQAVERHAMLVVQTARAAPGEEARMPKGLVQLFAPEEFASVLRTRTATSSAVMPAA